MVGVVGSSPIAPTNSGENQEVSRTPGVAWRFMGQKWGKWDTARSNSANGVQAMLCNGPRLHCCSATSKSSDRPPAGDPCSGRPPSILRFPLRRHASVAAGPTACIDPRMTDPQPPSPDRAEQPSLLRRIALAFGAFFGVLAMPIWPHVFGAARRACTAPTAAGGAGAEGRQPRRGAAAARAAAARGAPDRLRLRETSPATPTRDRRRRAPGARRLRARCCASTSASCRCATRPKAAASRCRRASTPRAVRLTGNVVGEPPFTRQPEPPRLARRRGAAAQARRGPRRARAGAGGGGAVSDVRSRYRDGYAIGIDLGTTHMRAVVASTSQRQRRRRSHRARRAADPAADRAGRGRGAAAAAVVPVPAARRRAGAPASWRCPGGRRPRACVGELARSRGATTPMRLVSSAKSWLCHPGVDRRAPILPHDAPPEVARVSPLEPRALPRAPAQRLGPRAPGGAVRRAGRDGDGAGLVRPGRARADGRGRARPPAIRTLTLLEEPQAALYSWIQASGGGWRKQVQPGDVILVVDVGGGTSDFSLIAVLERDGKLELRARRGRRPHPARRRQHGSGARALSSRASWPPAGTTLDAWQLRALTHACRAAKEKLLAERRRAEPAADRRARAAAAS